MRKLWTGLLATGLIGALVISLTGSASAGPAKRAASGKATIAMKHGPNGVRPVFVGPKKIDKGTRLTIVNRTSTRRVGPHTFTLINKGETPRSVQNQLLKAHRVEFIEDEYGEIVDVKTNRRVVDSGKKGWNKGFSPNRSGDSWFTDKRGASHTRRVTARVGKTLRYYCDIHRNMRGKFEVTR